MVYVDASRYPFGRMVMCHMIADSLPELHALAERIGVQWKWFQATASTPHYDICKSKRRLAVQAGAVELRLVEFGRKLRELRKAGTTEEASA